MYAFKILNFKRSISVKKIDSNFHRNLLTKPYHHKLSHTSSFFNRNLHSVSVQRSIKSFTVVTSRKNTLKICLEF